MPHLCFVRPIAKDGPSLEITGLPEGLGAKISEPTATVAAPPPATAGGVAEDVKFTIDRVLNPATQSRFATNFANIERVEIDGPYIVNFYLKAPDATLLQRLTVTRPSGGLIVSKKAVTELGDKYASQPIGTGPFVFESHVPREKVVLVANKEYYARVRSSAKS